jgi:hypothetical protein
MLAGDATTDPDDLDGEETAEAELDGDPYTEPDD